MQMICTWSSWCHCHQSSVVWFKSRYGLSFLLSSYPGCSG